jgi:hypothetical protein
LWRHITVWYLPYTNNRINLLNIYALFDRQLFWEQIEARGLLDLDNLIIAGDLNLTIMLEKFGGPLLHLTLWQITSLLFSLHIIWWIMHQILDSNLAQWTCGSRLHFKRLDRFLIIRTFISSKDRIHSWVIFPFLSDHAPIILQLDSSPLKIAYPFKLNSGWLLEAEFNSIVVDVWKDPFSFELCIQHRLFGSSNI